MANFQNRYKDSQEGAYFIDQDCIACDTCAIIAPNHFKLTSDFDHAVIHRQPQNQAELIECENAEQACPVSAIGRKP